MALTPEEQSALEQLQAKAKEPDNSGEDFEIEIYNPHGAGARVPYSRGRSFLQREFGIDLDPDPGQETGNGEPPADDTGTGVPKGKAGGNKQPARQGGKQQNGQSPEGEREGGSYWSRRSAR